MTRRTAPRLLLAAAVAVSLAACGSDESSGAAAPTSSACETQQPTAEAPAGISTDLSVRPAAPCYDAEPPTDLVVSDVVVGSGAEAVAGSAVAVKYVGSFYETGEAFDASWDSGDDTTFPVTLGAGQVIAGFDQGITGMQVGGRRMVVIPSGLGYGPDDAGPIPGGSTLVFVIDLVSVG